MSKMQAGIKRSRRTRLIACLAVALICAEIALIAVSATRGRGDQQRDAKPPNNASPSNFLNCNLLFFNLSIGK